jgi:hypothetical protein
MSGTEPMHAAARWHTLSVSEQMANVGSEVERTLRARAAKPERLDAAMARARELFDLSATDPRWPLHRRREILRAREEFCRLFFDAEVPERSAEGLRRYFLAFAVAVRSRS